MNERDRRHLKQGEGWTRCGRRWSEAAGAPEDWPLCKVCERSCKELEPPEPKGALCNLDEVLP